MRSLLLICALSSSACVTPHRSIAGKIGCSPDEVHIVDSDSGALGLFAPVMRVQCHNQEFICSGKPGTNMMDEMNCARAVRRPKPSMSAAYIGREDLQNEKNQSFDEFLEELSEPESTKQ